MKQGNGETMYGESLLVSTDISEYRGDFLGYQIVLSDGEKQKIACASIDVSGTDIILLDEPSAHLDYESTLALRELILCWRRQGKTIIAAEHRIAWLWDLIDRAVILRDGTIIKQLRGAERDDLSADALRAMGLRSPAQEAPESITLPAVTCEDKTMLLRDLRFSYPGAEFLLFFADDIERGL